MREIVNHKHKLNINYKYIFLRKVVSNGKLLGMHSHVLFTEFEALNVKISRNLSFNL